MTNTILELPARCILRIGGSDATEFLNGQLTVAVTGRDRKPRLAAWCDAKGRVVALFRVFPESDDGWLLSFPADLKEVVTKRLKMFVLRSNVDIADVSADYVHCVAEAPDSSDAATTPSLSLPVENGWCEWLASSEYSTGEDATAAQIGAGIPDVFAATSGKWVPQWLNLDELDAIDFNKGCYPGQEVVAKLKYRGAVKRRLARITNPTADSEIVISNTSAQGTVDALVVQRDSAV